jgi:16S rRNA (cytidine1402-2'-O)-methyltransferase
VVATPIGNLDDLSPRARQALADCDLILAEDTRRVRKLLNHFGITTRAQAFHEHNEQQMQRRALALLERGARLALVCDAGTPLLADPGYRLVHQCRTLGVPVIAVPGPSAVVAAVSVAGLPPIPFTFMGFLPPTGEARRRTLARAASLTHTLVFFLSPHRLAAELRDCAEVLGGQRPAALAAELTKRHERCLLAPLADLASSAEAARPRGEYTLVVGPPELPARGQVTPQQARAAVEQALAAGWPLAEARRQAAQALGITRRQLYQLLLA